jgi:hypothetical protein
LNKKKEEAAQHRDREKDRQRKERRRTTRTLFVGQAGVGQAGQQREKDYLSRIKKP